MVQIHSKKNRISKKGLPPGTMMYTGEVVSKDVRITVHRYTKEQLDTFEIKKEELPDLFLDKEHKIWVDVDGLNDIDTVVMICESLGVHLLHLEDLLNVYQRPKLEEEDEYTVLIVKMIHHLDERGMNAHVEQLSFLLKDNFLITFQEKEGDVFDPIRERIKKPATKIRERKTDYLLYVLFDIVVDSYLENLGKLEEFQERMEAEMMEEVAQYDLKNIQRLKKVLLEHKKAIWPLKEIIHRMARVDKSWIEEENKKYFNDLQDHVYQAHEMLESQLDLHNGIKDLYMNRMNRNLNNVMKMLTIISTIFIPLTFIAGVYGMNFKYMPELYTKNGYFVTLGVMFIIGMSLLVYFKVKKWM